jgi:hypothetical protein
MWCGRKTKNNKEILKKTKGIVIRKYYYRLQSKYISKSRQTQESNILHI